MQYLLDQMLMFLLAAGLLGLLTGWLLWGMRLRRARERTSEMEQRVSKLSGFPARMTDLEATYAAFIASKNEEDARGKARVAELERLLAERTSEHPAEMEASVKAKEAEIAEQLQAHSDKDARLASLTSRLDDSAALKALVTELRAELEARDTQIAGLLIEVEQHAAANAEKAAGIAELAATAALVPQLKASLEAQGNHMAELAGQLEQHAAAQAEKNTQIAQLAAAQAKTETPKARPSPSAGFYEVPPAATPAHQPPQNHVLEFEKRIADLRAIEAKKDEEISKLNNRLADLEKQPDPDVRRQILFSAKNAELTHFRAVLNSLFQPLNPDEVAQRAYSYAQERHFQGGSPVEDWTRAERDSHFVRLAQAWESTRPGTMF